MVMTSQQQSTVTRLENKGFQYVYATGDLVLVEKGSQAFYIKTDGTYFAE